jgi:hypothetical protein
LNIITNSSHSNLLYKSSFHGNILCNILSACLLWYVVNWKQVWYCQIGYPLMSTRSSLRFVPRMPSSRWWTVSLTTLNFTSKTRNNVYDSSRNITPTCTTSPSAACCKQIPQNKTEKSGKILKRQTEKVQ